MSVLSPSTASATTEPPPPPSPPSGPPNSIYFSRRKLMQPAPPLPERIYTFARSRNFMADPFARRGPRATLAHPAAVGPCGHLGPARDAVAFGVPKILKPAIRQDPGRSGVVLEHAGKDRARGVRVGGENRLDRCRGDAGVPPRGRDPVGDLGLAGIDAREADEAHHLGAARAGAVDGPDILGPPLGLRTLDQRLGGTGRIGMGNIGRGPCHPRVARVVGDQPGIRAAQRAQVEPLRRDHRLVDHRLESHALLLSHDGTPRFKWGRAAAPQDGTASPTPQRDANFIGRGTPGTTKGPAIAGPPHVHDISRVRLTRRPPPLAAPK